MHFQQGHGISIGSETSGGVHNVTLTNLSMDGTANGMRVKSARGRGNSVTNILYENMVMRNIGSFPITVNMAYGDACAEWTGECDLPVFQNFTVRNVVSVGSGGSMNFLCLNASRCSGFTFENISITGARAGYHCEYVYGTATGVTPPMTDCLNRGGPAPKPPAPPPRPPSPPPPAPHRCTVQSQGQRCFNDTVRGSLLPTPEPSTHDKSTLEVCALACFGQKHVLAGIDEGNHCYCGGEANLDSAAARAKNRPLAECQVTPCKADPSEKCGGVDRLLVYRYNCSTVSSSVDGLPRLKTDDEFQIDDAESSAFDWIRQIVNGPPGRKYRLDAKTYLIDKQYQLPSGTELRGVGTSLGHRTEIKAVGQPYNACAGTASAPGLHQGRKGLLLGDDTYVSGLHMRGMETRRLDCLYAMIETPGCANSEGNFPAPPNETGPCGLAGRNLNCCGGYTGNDGHGVQNATVEDVTVENFTTQNMFFMAPTAASKRVSRDITVRNVRMNGSWADGVNIHGQHQNVMVEGCTVIDSGDDNFAMWSIAAGQNNVTFKNCTAIRGSEKTKADSHGAAGINCCFVNFGGSGSFIDSRGKGCGLTPRPGIGHGAEALVVFGCPNKGNPAFGGTWDTSSTVVVHNVTGSCAGQDGCPLCKFQPVYAYHDGFPGTIDNPACNISGPQSDFTMVVMGKQLKTNDDDDHFVTAAGSPFAAAAKNDDDGRASKGLLWLALGDSITWGCGTDSPPHGADSCVKDAGGYRIPLAWSLSQAGFNVSTMGTLRTGPDYVPAQWLRHEGHDGWRIDQIDAVLNASFASSAAAPDLVTIHLGTNDCYQRATTATMNTRLNSLLTHIHAAAPNTTTFLASILDFPRNTACVHEFNAGLPAIVATFNAAGMRIIYAPINEISGLCTATEPLTNLCCGHRMHPTAPGYLRMASAWGLSLAEHGYSAGGARFKSDDVQATADNEGDKYM